MNRRMTRDEIIAKLKDTAPALRAEGVTRLAIFGSRARGDAHDDSDLDVLIDVDSNKFAGLDVVRVKHIIEQATGIAATPRSRLS
jgi:predicted nucleotidyltransferase